MQITGLAIADRVWRAYYWLDRDVEKFDVIGWAVLGPDVWPVRMVKRSGRGVLVGSELDPWRDRLLGVSTPGEDWKSWPGLDEQIRQLVIDEVEDEDE